MATPTATVKNEAAAGLCCDRNHAAEQLRDWFIRRESPRLLDEALAFERHAAVERIKAQCDEAVEKWGVEALPVALLNILSKEAAR